MADWGGLSLGDVVCRVGRSHRMIVLDLDLDDRRSVICGWLDRWNCPRELVYRTSGLVRVKAASRS